MADRPSERSGEPLVAVLLSWFLPGAGHVYVGRIGFGVVAFLVVEGLFAAGLLLTQGRTFEFLDPELRGVMATALTPEVGNLGGLIWQLKNHGFGALEPGPFPPHMMTGVWLTAISGMVNACLLVHVHLSARTARAYRSAAPHPAGICLLAWLVPGLGHLAQGRRLRGAIVFVLLVGLFAWGTWLADASNLSRERHFYYWSGQFLAGLPALVTEFASGRPPVTHELRWGDVGLLYGCMAGLLNVLAMLDVYAVAERRYLAEPAPAAAAPSPDPGPQVV
jgi:TM2 domain-containing membrane protein YozV